MRPASPRRVCAPALLLAAKVLPDRVGRGESGDALQPGADATRAGIVARGGYTLVVLEWSLHPDFAKIPCSFDCLKITHTCVTTGLRARDPHVSRAKATRRGERGAAPAPRGDMRLSCVERRARATTLPTRAQVVSLSIKTVAHASLRMRLKNDAFRVHESENSKSVNYVLAAT